MIIQTLDVTAKEWFDKVNGNSYFSARVHINFGMPDATHFCIPFEYGYGDSYEQATVTALIERGYITKERADLTPALWRVCNDLGIILRKQKITRCTKKEVKQYAD